MTTVSPAIVPTSPLSEKNTIESWLIENEQKLRAISTFLSGKQSGNYFETNDFYQNICLKLWWQAQLTKGFAAMPSKYLLKIAWNEGRMMIRKQRKYEMVVSNNSAFIPEGDEEDFDFLDTFPTDDSEKPEAQQIRAEENELLKLAVESLPTKSREVCMLLYAGQKPAQIAKTLGLSSRSGITYHLNNIRRVFEQYGLQTA
jgi:RNA polymerase sigma factor (sigma-70 family)